MTRFDEALERFAASAEQSMSQRVSIADLTVARERIGRGRRRRATGWGAGIVAGTAAVGLGVALAMPGTLGLPLEPAASQSPTLAPTLGDEPSEPTPTPPSGDGADPDAIFAGPGLPLSQISSGAGARESRTVCERVADAAQLDDLTFYATSVPVERPSFLFSGIANGVRSVSWTWVEDGGGLRSLWFANQPHTTVLFIDSQGILVSAAAASGESQSTEYQGQFHATQQFVAAVPCDVQRGAPLLPGTYRAVAVIDSGSLSGDLAVAGTETWVDLGEVVVPDKP